MKKYIFSLFLLVTAFSFSSCDEENLLTKDIYLTLPVEYVINEATATTWNDSILLDAIAQSTELADYANVIQSVKLDKATYQITVFNGPAGQILNNGTIDIANESGNNRMTLLTMSNVDIPAVVGQEIEAPVSDTAAAVLVNLIKETPHKAMVYTQGTVSTAPIDMTVKVQFYLTVKVELL
jgi:hypothetical protein